VTQSKPGTTLDESRRQDRRAVVAFDQDATDNKAFLAAGKLSVPENLSVRRRQ